MHTAPFKNASRVSSLLEILAGRTASELERMQNESDRDRLKQAVEQASESIVITDSEAIIQYVNPAFEETTGYTREEAIGQNPRILKSGKQDNAFYKGMWDMLLQGASWSGKFINKKKDGTNYSVEANISPVQDKSGKTVSYISIQRDISHERELEQQLLQAQKMESVGTLAGGIAHDFNNILQAILGFTSIARENTTGNTELLTQCLREIDAGGQRAADLVSQILTFSRTSDVEFKPLTLQTVIEEALRFLRSSIPTTIQIETKIGTECGPVMGNATQIHQVVTNLCTNAMHAMDEKGGVLAVSLERRSIDSLLETLSGPLEPGAYIELVVGDTGAGIERHLFERLLDPFFTTKEVGKGTGLGLAMVHGIVQEMGGGLSIESTVGEGTTIRVICVPGMAPYL
jgi:PAS domain S-box-containing protein